MSTRGQVGAAVSSKIGITEPVTGPLAAARGACSAPAGLSILQRSGGTRRQNWRLILRVFLPFTAAFFLSYLFRSINAPISSDLTSELALDAADLGFLTSVYFLTFAAVQLPVGIWLDRFGPRRVQGALLLFAAAGAMLFCMSKRICSTRSGPRAHWARSRSGIHWRTQSDRPLVPERPRRCNERLDGHARRSGGAERHVSSRAVARLERRLARAVRDPRCRNDGVRADDLGRCPRSDIRQAIIK